MIRRLLDAVGVCSLIAFTARSSLAHAAVTGPTGPGLYPGERRTAPPHNVVTTRCGANRFLDE